MVFFNDIYGRSMVSADTRSGTERSGGMNLRWLWFGDRCGDRKPCPAVVRKFTKCPEDPLLGKLPQDKPRSLGRVCMLNLPSS